MIQLIRLLRDPSIGAQIGMQAANNAIGAGMGLLLQKHNDKRQLKQQGKLLEQQYGIDNRMAEANYARQMRLFQDTGYEAQMKQLKEAGLNPALMYKSGGPGGTTAAATGAVHGASAPAGGMEIMNMMMNKAQMELIQAQTKKTEAEAGAIPTTVKKTEAETDLVLQNIKNAQSQQQYTEAMTAWQQLETKFAKESYHTRQNQIEAQLDQSIQTIRQIGLQNDFTQETWNTAISQLEANVIQTQLHSQLLEAQKRATEKGIQLTDAQISKMTADIAQGWEKLRLEAIQGQRETVKLAQTDVDLMIKQVQTEFNTTHPGLWNVAGGQVERIIKETVDDIRNKLKKMIPKY